MASIDKHKNTDSPAVIISLTQNAATNLSNMRVNGQRDVDNVIHARAKTIARKASKKPKGPTGSSYFNKLKSKS